MKTSALLLVSVVLAAVAGCRSSGAGERGGDGPLLIHGGTIHVGDGAGTTVPALAVRDGRVVFAGELDGARAAAGPNARELDLAGATAVPGLQDAHGHTLGLGASLEAVELGDTRSYDEVIERIAAAAADLPKGTWITGRGWDQTRWPGAQFPNHAPLSARVPDHPVFVRRVDGHAALANLRALELAGLAGDGALPSVAGGSVRVDADGRATGVLVDAAMSLVGTLIPAPSDDDVRRRALLAQERLLSEGLTCVHDMGLGPRDVAALRALDATGELKLRIAGYLWGNDGLSDPWYDEAARERDGRGARGRFRIAGVKLMIDGALGSRGAALLEPYSDAPAEDGLLQMPAEVYRALVERCASLGLQPATHAIGDRGNRVVLDAYERVEELDPGFRALRPRLEHAQVVAVEDLPRLARLGVIPSMQPRHATSDMRWAEDRVGAARIEGAYAWRALATKTTPLAFGSDFPVEPSAPLLGLYAARTRQDEGGDPPGGWRPAHRMSGAEALAGFTTGAAFAVHEENERGRLAPGFFADLTVLDGDPVACEPRELLSMRVLATVIEGELVYEAR